MRAATWHHAGFAGTVLLALGGGSVAPDPGVTVIILPRTILDSMSAIWLRSNEGARLRSSSWLPQDRISVDQSRDRIEVVVWDVDSLDAALRASDGQVIHPAPIIIR